MTEGQSEFQRLPNAPIVEAIIDFRLSFVEPLDLSKLQAFGDAIADRYPARKETESFSHNAPAKRGA